MRWVLPGGAELDGRDERAVACRPLGAVREGTVPRRWQFGKWLRSTVKLLLGRIATFFSRDRLPTVKLWLEVLALVVGLVGGILALLAGLRK
jgi:hypothetical protein